MVSVRPFQGFDLRCIANITYPLERENHWFDKTRRGKTEHSVILEEVSQCFLQRTLTCEHKKVIVFVGCHGHPHISMTSTQNKPVNKRSARQLELSFSLLLVRTASSECQGMTARMFWSENRVSCPPCRKACSDRITKQKMTEIPEIVCAFVFVIYPQNEKTGSMRQ